MASLEQLPPDQRAVLQMVLQRGRGYDDIARMLGIDRAAVRERALSAFDALGPQTRVAPERRALITDYLLGQLPPRVTDMVRGRLSESASERAWARVIAGELGTIAAEPLPEIPGHAARRAPDPSAAPAPHAPPPDAAASSGAAAATPRTGEPPESSQLPPPRRRAPRDEQQHDQDQEGATEVAEPPRRRERQRPSRRAAAAAAGGGGVLGSPTRRSSRTGGIVLLAIIGLVIVAAIVIAITQSGGSSPPKRQTAIAGTSTTAPAQTSTGTGTGTSTSPAPHIVAQLNLTSPVAGSKAVGVAQVIKQGSTTGIALEAQGLPPNSKHPVNAYAVWLYNSPTDAEIIGFVSTLVGSNGRLTTGGALPKNASHFHQIVVSLETTAKPHTPGKIMLSGALTGL